MDSAEHQQDEVTGLETVRKGPRPLTAKNRSFLQHLAHGKQTLEAYALAGYRGEPHAAYQLRSDLKEHLQQLLEQGGWSREQIAVEANKLMALPLDPNVQNVNFKQKLDLLKFMDKALSTGKGGNSRPNITPVVIGINRPEQVTISDSITKGELPA